MKKLLTLIALLLPFSFGFELPTNAAKYDASFCEQFKGQSKIWWDGIELKSGQIGRLIIQEDTPLFKLEGEERKVSRTLKAGEFYRIYAFKPGLLSVGGGYYVDRDDKVTYQTPSKTKLAAVRCINNPDSFKDEEVVTEPAKKVYISDADFEWESITVMNDSEENIDISGWYLISEEGNQKYTFPEGSIIEAGYYIKVLSGPNSFEGSFLQVWTTSYIWNNNGDAALLYNSKGELVSEYR